MGIKLRDVYQGGGIQSVTMEYNDLTVLIRCIVRGLDLVRKQEL